MTHAIPSQDIQIKFSSDKSEALILLRGDFPRSALSASYCRFHLESAGVKVTPAVAGAIDKLMVNLPPDGTEARVIIARRTEPKHGKDGWVQWIEDEAGKSTTKPTKPADPVANASNTASADNLQSLSFYNCSSYIMVRTGQVVGKIHPPTPEQDGCDLAGSALKAKPGKPAAVQLNESILCDAQGRLIAQIEGVLQRNHLKAKVSPVLDISSYVDFSTGNIEFKGDVLVHQGVRDCFSIKATGSVEVHGLIEAAIIECDVDLVARGGIAGHQRAKIKVGQHLIARYLDNVIGEMVGDLQVEREAINCDLIVGGNVRMPHAALIGGRLVVTGNADIGTIGSNAGVATELVFGSVPLLESKLKQLDDEAIKLIRQQETMRHEQQFLEGQKRSLSPQQKERMTEVMYELHQSQESLKTVQSAAKEIRDTIAQHRSVSFNIQRRLHQATRITIRDRTYRVDKDVAGPLTIGLDHKGNPVIAKSSSAPVPLTTIARSLTQ